MPTYHDFADCLEFSCLLSCQTALRECLNAGPLAAITFKIQGGSRFRCQKCLPMGRVNARNKLNDSAIHALMLLQHNTVAGDRLFSLFSLETGTFNIFPLIVCPRKVVGISVT